MKVLFLDIDGVVNCESTTQRHRGYIGIDPHMAFRVGKITLEVPDLKVVLSSCWRMSEGGLKEVESQVVPIFDVTPDSWYDKDKCRRSWRGEEIDKWINQHPEIIIDRYAILDDDPHMLREQEPNFFRTSWLEGINDKIMNNVICHFNGQTK